MRSSDIKSRAVEAPSGGGRADLRRGAEGALAPKRSQRRSKKVVQLTSAHDVTDERIFRKECRSLADAGYDVTLVVVHDGDAVIDGIRIRAVAKAKQGRVARFLTTVPRVLKAAWSERADVYHFHDPELMPAGVLLRLTGAKVVYDVHEDLPRQISQKAWLPHWQRPLIARTMAAVEWACSRAAFSGVVTVVPEIASRFPAASTIIACNYPVLDEVTVDPDTTPYPNRAPVALYAGGISSIRGSVEMVQAVSLVATPGASLEIAGPVHHKSVLTHVRALPGWDKTTFHGWRTPQEVRDLASKARIGLLTEHPVPNHQIALPIKLFEYMRAGLPVIVGHLPLWESIVRRHDCGLAVDPLDPVAIARAIDWIFAHPEEAEAMGERGRRAVLDHYNWNMEEVKLIAFYDRLLGIDP
jgi:glycosyltransferase involved in cell wall biosynthesis